MGHYFNGFGAIVTITQKSTLLLLESKLFYPLLFGLDHVDAPSGFKNTFDLLDHLTVRRPTVRIVAFLRIVAKVTSPKTQNPYSKLPFVSFFIDLRFISSSQ